MSRGYEGIYKLISIDKENALYAYSGDKFSFPAEEKLADSLDGRLQINLCVLENNECFECFDCFEKGNVKVLKDCYYAEKNELGIDIFAFRAVLNILSRYEESKELPKDGHWVV
ncbi:MAG: hypothetical protein E6X34_10900 [Clostridium sp.]|uniref:hypothetical protein n=1 Tax=Clostridium sp. TaxID=1506 RepID=UPI002911650F|nr:hypothetical protein [Clostridium sp.]MDU4938952.1 hypothetical protein [Clostridium sp.]